MAEVSSGVMVWTRKYLMGTLAMQPRDVGSLPFMALWLSMEQSDWLVLCCDQRPEAHRRPLWGSQSLAAYSSRFHLKGSTEREPVGELMGSRT